MPQITEDHRARFELDIPAIARCTFLNTADQGPKLACVHNAMQELENDTFLNSPSLVEVYDRLHAARDVARTRLAAFFHAEEGETVFVRGIAEGLNLLLPLLGLREGDEVLTTNEENPAVLMPLLEMARTQGIVPRLVPVADSRQGMLDAMEAAFTPRTRLVVMSHVSHVGGFCQPLTEITAMAHRHGARIIWDGAQSAGQVPLDFAASGCDVYLAAGYKWMLGMHGTTVMLMRKDLVHELRPTHIGVGSEQRFDAASLTCTLKEDGRKFEYGSRFLPPFAALGFAARYLDILGMSAVRRRVLELRGELMIRLHDLPDICLLSTDDPETGSGIVGFTFPDFDPEAFVRHAWETERLVIKTRNLNPGLHNTKSIRVSLHFFNTLEEVERLYTLLKHRK